MLLLGIKNVLIPFINLVNAEIHVHPICMKRLQQFNRLIKSQIKDELMICLKDYAKVN